MPTLTIEMVLIATVIAWHYSLFCGYISDDHAAVAKRKDIIPDQEKVDRKEPFWIKRFNDGLVMFYLKSLFWSLGFRKYPLPWHAFSLWLHVANTYLLYLVLFPIIGYEKALYTCAFWSVSPILNQNVVWISGSPYLIGMFLGLIAMMGWDNPLIFMPFYLLGVVTNICIVFIPLLLAFLHPESILPKLYFGFMFLTAVPFVIWKFNKRFTNGLVLDRNHFRWNNRKLNVIARMTLYYVEAILVPTKMGWYHEQGFAYNKAWEKFNYKTLAGYLLLLGFALSGIPGLWWILGFIPVSNLFATNSFLQDRYLYFCSVGFAIILSGVFMQYPLVFFMAMTFYMTRAYMYSRYMHNDEILYRKNWENHPDSDNAVNNLAYFLINQHRYDEARVVVERGLTINPNNKMLWYNLGITYTAQGHFANEEGKLKLIRAIQAFNKCLKIEPRWEKPMKDLQKIIPKMIEMGVLVPNTSSEKGGMVVDIPNFILQKDENDKPGSSNDNTVKQDAGVQPA